MGRAGNISPLGLYRWDNTVFDLMTIPTALDRNTLIDNLLAETAELEVLYPNPVVFKNLVGVWSAKQIDIWNRLYATTQYEYNPIENYNRYETGSESGSGSTTHSGTDTTADTTTHSGTDATTETTTHGGTDGRTESLTTSGSDTLNMTRAEGGTEGKTISVETEDTGHETTVNTKQDSGTESESSTSSIDLGGQDTVTGADTKGHWVAGFDAPQPSGSNDGLVKQTRDQDDVTTTTAYGKTEDGTGSKTTTFGKLVTENGTVSTNKTGDSDTTEETTFGKTETNTDQTTYGKRENVQETKTYGETVAKQGGLTHGEVITKQGSLSHGEEVTNITDGEHELHAHGNIGVTTTQKLIMEQRDIELFNLYDIIIEDFKMRFCILIY